jgi:dTDP-glucose 4,6-dehydratase
MKVAVTGSKGTLGKPLCHALREDGHTVTQIDLQHGPATLRADVAEYRQIAEALSGQDVVYHLAAEFGRHNGEDYYEQLWRTNVIGTKNILEAQANGVFGKLIFASSSEVYGEQDRELLHEQDVASAPAMLTNDYAVTKWVNESQIAAARRRHGTEAMVLRFFNAYGPGEYYHRYRSVVCLFAYRAIHNLPYTVYDGYHRVFQYVDDLVATVSRAVDRFVDGAVINVGGTEYRSVNELHEVVSRAAGVDIDRGLVTLKPTDEMNIVNKRPDIERARAFLAHDPSVTLEEGVARTIEWMREVYGASA